MPNVIEISDFAAPELDVYARLTEGQLKNRADLARGLFIAESPNVILRALDAGYEPVSLLMERRHVEGQAAEVVARCGEVPVYVSDLPVLTQLTGFPLTRGVLCAMRRRPLRSMEEVCEGARRVAVLEDIMNPTNLIIAGKTVRAVIELAGIKNIRAKCLRSNNPTNVVKATFEGLKALRTAEEVAAVRGIDVEKVNG